MSYKIGQIIGNWKIKDIDGPDVLVEDNDGKEEWIGIGDLELMGEPNREDFPSPQRTKSGFYDDIVSDASDPHHFHN